MPNLAATMTVLEPYPGLYAYYDGRGKRLYSGGEELAGRRRLSAGHRHLRPGRRPRGDRLRQPYPADHARAVRDHLEGLGVTTMRLVLSHWHTDHIAGNAIFADCEIIANRLTAKALIENVKTFARKTPPINPVVMPNRLFDRQMTMTLGERRVELMQFDIHSADGTVLFLPDEGILLPATRWRTPSPTSPNPSTSPPTSPNSTG